MPHDVNPESVLAELGKIAFADIGETFETNAESFSAEFVAKKLGSVASSVKFKTTKDGCELEVKMIDKLKAIEMCARYLGMENADADNKNAPSVVVNYDYADRDEVS